MLLIILTLFPVIGGLILPMLNKIQNQNTRLGAVVLIQSIEVVLGFIVIFGDKISTGTFTLVDQISVGFTADTLAKFFVALVIVGWTLVTLYACVYMKHEENEMRFFLFMFLSEGVMLGAALSENLVSMYVFYEMVTLFSMPLVLHSLSKESVAAAKKYLYYSVAGAFLALFGIFVLATNSNTLSFVAGGVDITTSPLVLVGVFTMLLGFGAKAGLFPMHGWLPTAHPVAPAPASALLSGLIAKAGVLAIIRTVFYIVGTDALTGTWVQTVALSFALLTVLMGSMMAYLEKGFKKRLAFSTVSQISYVLTGLFLFTDDGFTGALWQIVFHAVVKVGLFLCAGAVIFMYGKTEVKDLKGMAKKMPITFTCFTVLSLSLIGIPPTGGFYSKWYIATSALSADLGALSYIAPIILLISAILTAAYLLSISIDAFFGKEEVEIEKKREPLLMVVPIIILTVIAVLGGVFSLTTSGILASVL